MKFQFLLLFFIFILSFTTCKKDEADSLLLFITPPELHLTGNSNQIISFVIDASSESRLERVYVNYKDLRSSTKTIFDTLLLSKTFSYVFEYKIPSFSDSSNIITLTFTAIDNDGNLLQSAREIRVSGTKYLLETAGHTLFSATSGKQDAYNLESLVALYSETADSVNQHIKDASLDSINGNTLSRKWISPSNAKFVLFNGFDYANATYSLLSNAYEAGVKQDFVDNIKEQDIILSKIGTNYIAIRIMNVYDLDSTTNDRYIFNIKQ